MQIRNPKNPPAKRPNQRADRKKENATVKFKSQKKDRNKYEICHQTPSAAAPLFHMQGVYSYTTGTKVGHVSLLYVS